MTSSKNMLGVAAGILLAPLAAFCQTETTINFGSLTPGSIVNTQYAPQGVTFNTQSATGALAPAAIGIGFTGGLSNSPTGSYPPKKFLDFNFTHPATIQSFAFDNYGDNGVSSYSAFSLTGALLGSGNLGSQNSLTAPVTLNLAGVSELQFSNGVGDGEWEFVVASVSFLEPFPLQSAFWHGQHGDGLWTTANWATNAAGAATTLIPTSITDVTFSATGGTHQNTVLGANFTIKSLTVNDPAAVTISGNNTLTISGTSGATGITVNAGAGTFTVNSNLILAGASQTITVNNSAGMLANGSIGGSVGLDKTGSGPLTLSGSNTYTGGTILNEGTLVVNNAHALGVGNVLVKGGLLMADPQPINVFGNYTQSAPGALLLHIGGASAGQYDFLNVTGHATLGGTLVLQSTSGFRLTLGSRITVVAAQGGVSGQFANVEAGSIFPTGTIAQPEVIYSDGTVLLTLEQGSFTQLARTPNQSAVAKDLDRVASDPSSSLIGFLDTQPVGSLPNEFDLLAPSDLSALYEISFSAANIQQANIEDRLGDVRDGSTGFSLALSIDNSEATQPNDGKNVLHDGKNKDVLQPSPENPWGVFVSGNGDFVSVDGDTNAKGYDFTTGGITLGVDYRVNKHFVIGAAFDYAHTWTGLSGNGSIDVDSGRGGIYATVFDGGLYLNGYAGGGYNSYDTQRAALLGDARGSTSGGEFDTFLDGGYDMRWHGLIFGPVTSLRYTYVGVNNFTESGSLAPLNIVSQDQSSLRTDLGLKLSYPWKHGSTVITPQVKASWQHEFEYSALPIDARLADGEGDVFKVYGPAIGRDSALVEAGARVQWTPKLATYLFYEGNVNPSYTSHTVNGGVEIGF